MADNVTKRDWEIIYNGSVIGTQLRYIEQVGQRMHCWAMSLHTHMVIRWMLMTMTMIKMNALTKLTLKVLSHCNLNTEIPCE